MPANVGIELTRAKVEPMVRGFFARAEQDVVLATLEKSVVYVTSDTIESIILNHKWDRSRWDLANMYLLSVGAKLLGKKAARIVGMSEEATCYVSPDYFAEGDPFADFIVHEAAHIFHNCKRRTIGLRETRTKEWLLDIEFRKRETFAYSCEAYARIVARTRNPAERRALAAEYGSKRRISAERVDPAEVASIVAEAASTRNGWRAILARCAPTTKPRSALQLAREMVGTGTSLRTGSRRAARARGRRPSRRWFLREQTLRKLQGRLAIHPTPWLAWNQHRLRR